MKAKLHQLVKGVSGALDAYPTRRTEAARIQGLLRSLYPRSLGHQLMRLGPDGDGGYLVPADLTGVSACFSPGVSLESGFDLDCAERGMRVFMADGSVDGPVQRHERFHFTKSFIGAFSSEGFLTLDTWVGRFAGSSDEDLVLQMDIEGFEYEVLLSASEDVLRRFRVIVIEFHDLHSLWSRPFFNLASRVFEKLLRSHTCVHLHPNNSSDCLSLGGLEIPRLMEFTFHRSDRGGDPSYVGAFPHPLDFDNTGNSTLRLPSCWYMAVG